MEDLICLLATVRTLKDTYQSSFSIDTKNIPVAFNLTSQWCFNDIRNWILRIFTGQFVKFSKKKTTKILGKCDFDFIIILLFSIN